jgi:hypothetical protein
MQFLLIAKFLQILIKKNLIKLFLQHHIGHKLMKSKLQKLQKIKWMNLMTLIPQKINPSKKFQGY